MTTLTAPLAGQGAADLGGPTLEERLEEAWRELHGQGAAACPLCGGQLALEGGAGRCESCGSELR